MMKLPGAVRTGVRGLAHMPSGAAAELAKGAAISTAFNVVGGLVGKMEEDRNNEEIRQLDLSMMQSQAELDNTLNKDAYSASEIPEGIDVRLNDKTFVSGVETSTPRNDIPAWEVKAQIYQQEMTKRIKAGAEKITVPSIRAEWLRDKEALIELNTTKLLGQAQEDQRKYNAISLEIDIDNAVENKDYDLALILSDDIKSQGKRATKKRELKSLKQDQLNEGYFANVDAMSNESSKLSRDGDTVGAQKAVDKASRDINALVESDAITEVKGEQIKRELNREVVEQGFRKEFSDTIEDEGVEVANDKLESLKGKTPEGWTPDEWDTYTNSQQVAINREIAKERAVKQAESQEAAIALNQYKSAVSIGFEVPPDEKLRVKLLVSDTDKQIEFDRINRIAAFSVLDYQDRSKEMKKSQTGKLGSVANFSAMIQANNEINKLALEDGYSLGVNQGLIEAISFDPSDPLTLALKADQAETLSDHYGVPVSPLTDGEADALSSNIDAMTTAEKVQLSMVLNESPSVWGQISPKNQQVFSMAGATGDRVLMSNVFKGEELIKAKLVSAPKSTDYLSVSDEFLSNVYGVQDKSAIVEAAKAHYAATVGNVDVVDSDGFEDSLAAVTGGIAEINGNKLELPRGVIKDDFEDFIDDFSAGNVKKLGGVLGFTDIEAAEMINDSKIKSIGANKYIVLTGETQALFGADGQPFVISFTEEIQSEQQAKRFMKAKTIESAIKDIRSF